MAVRTAVARAAQGARDPQGRHRRRARRPRRRQARHGRACHPTPARRRGGRSMFRRGSIGRRRERRGRGRQHRQAPHQAAPDARARPTACPRSSRAASSRSPSPCRSARSWSCARAAASRPASAHAHAGQRPPRARLPPLRRAAGGEVVTSRLHERYAAEIVPALQKQFEYGNPNQVPQGQQDRRQHRSGRGPDQCQGARCGPGRPDRPSPARSRS